MGRRGDGLDIDENAYRLHLCTLLAKTPVICISYIHTPSDSCTTTASKLTPLALYTRDPGFNHVHGNVC
jgi:hypothetical protein